jgi:hypothetical protein
MAYSSKPNGVLRVTSFAHQLQASISQATICDNVRYQGLFGSHKPAQIATGT